MGVEDGRASEIGTGESGRGSGRGLFLEPALEGRVARLRIHLPPVNVLAVGDLEIFARRVAECRQAAVLLLTGLPRAFSAGVDVADHAPERRAIDRMLGAMRRALEALVESPAVTIAAVSGACLGGGAEIASACDLVFIAQDARIGFPEITLGCFPPAGVALLPERIGSARAAEWILTGRIASGREAARAGFANRAIPGSEVESEAARVAHEIAARSGAALAKARELLRQSRRDALARHLPGAETSYRELAGNEDLARAVAAFRKQKP